MIENMQDYIVTPEDYINTDIEGTIKSGGGCVGCEDDDFGDDE